MAKHQSKIEKLIEELCPDGVEYVQLSDICCYSSTRISASELNNSNYVGVDNLLQNKLGKTDSNYVPTKGNFTRFIIGDVLLGNIRPYLKKVWLATHEGGTNGDVLVLRINDKSISSKYLYYLLSSDSFFHYFTNNSKGTKMPRGDKDSVLKYSVPVPPMEVQEEIVKILDKFTQLEAELEAELEARKKQYDHYRNSLLTFDPEVEWKPLGQVADIGTGGSNTDEGLEVGKYPFFVRSPIIRYKDSYEFDEIAIITSGDGVGVGKIFHYIDGKYALHQRAYRIHILYNQLIPKFFFHYMRNTFEKYIKTNAVNSSVTSVRRPMLDKYPTPIPSLSVQEKIVTILDKFEALVNDISVGLPAELAARRKQYEHYRNKLLTFGEKNGRK